MCGIVGVLNYKRSASYQLTEAMIHTLAHRGPDDEGVWATGSVAFGHRRLSVIDLSTAGHQPMHFTERGLTITFNGEIYNFLALRAELERLGYTFDSHTDTEVILKGYDAWSDAVFAKLRGMFALAIWDEPARELILARDPFGIKPLYYTQCGDDWLFASEVKSLRLHPLFSSELDVASLSYYLSHAYVPEPYSIFRNVKRLPAGSTLHITADKESLRPYFQIPAIDPVSRNYPQTQQQLIDVLQDSVNAHQIADVPLGVFLSGGVDSSVIVALMRRAGQQKIKTFSIGFGADSHAYDERIYAQRVAEYFHTEHYEVVVEPNLLNYVRDTLYTTFDEPFANPAALICDVLSEFARQHVTVALAGVGADELFGGYPRYLGMMWLNRLNSIPSPVHFALERALAASRSSADKRNLLSRIRRYSRALNEPLDRRYEYITSFNTSGIDLLNPDAVRQHEIIIQPEANDLEHWLEADLSTYLPGDLLTYTDRASMRHALEVRVPFCDTEVLGFARGVTERNKIHRGELKYILKDSFKTLIPQEVLFRKKHGFALPIGEWLAGPFKSIIQETLNPMSLKRQPYLDANAVNKLIREFESGQRQHGFLIWSLLVFSMWQQQERVNA